MKRKQQWMFAGVLCLALGMTLASCKDDEEPGTGGEPRTEEEQTRTEQWWNVVSQLAETNQFPENWQTATFEPTIGEASETDPYTRIVPTNDLATAAQRFADLTNTYVDETTVGYEWTNSEVGSLTYKRGGPNDTYLAQVDVALKQMPTLKRILYMTPEQIGENGSFAGTAYYRFGDVVKKESNGQTEYWVCVRPAFGPEGKEDSHWVCLNVLPDKNVQEYPGNGSVYTDKNGVQWNWKMPTGLGNSKEHMENFAEMLAAIHNPTQYFAVLGQDTKAKIFHDFSRKNLQYHNEFFWQNVKRGWTDNTIFYKVFGLTEDALFQAVNQAGLRFIYNGHSWWYKSSWKCSLYEASYTGQNLKTSQYKTVVTNMQGKEFNIKSFYNHPSSNTNFFGDNNKRFVLRYATGKQLCQDANGKNGSYNVKTALSNCEDVYVYNRYFYKDAPNGFCDLNKDPEVSTSIAETRGFFQPGTVIQDAQGNKWICYQGWCNNSDMNVQSLDRKAHFISFDAVDGREEYIDYAENSDYDSGEFATNVPTESEAFMIAYMLAQAASPASSSATALNVGLKDYMGVEPTDLVIQRDSVVTFGGTNAKASIVSTNIAYIPQGGRKNGRQPILRYVMDGTRVAGNRVAGKDPYRYHYFYQKYSPETDAFHLGATLDACDSWEFTNQLAYSPVEGDRWSRCAHPNSTARDWEFSIDDSYSGQYNWSLYKYDTQNKRWLNRDRRYTNRNGLGVSGPKYLSVYYEPVLFVTTMTIDDDNSTNFKETYGGRRYTLVGDPMTPTYKELIGQDWYNLMMVDSEYTFLEDNAVYIFYQP